MIGVHLNKAEFLERKVKCNFLHEITLFEQKRWWQRFYVCISIDCLDTAFVYDWKGNLIMCFTVLYSSLSNSLRIIEDVTDGI